MGALVLRMHNILKEKPYCLKDSTLAEAGNQGNCLSLGMSLVSRGSYQVSEQVEMILFVKGFEINVK